MTAARSGCFFAGFGEKFRTKPQREKVRKSCGLSETNILLRTCSHGRISGVAECDQVLSSAPSISSIINRGNQSLFLYIIIIRILR